ncbi:hypothetical protein GF420_07510 [candidate division GN15 bacterium]|nr:hypothetical protein [candidate division GN15 bacterium]
MRWRCPILQILRERNSMMRQYPLLIALLIIMSCGLWSESGRCQEAQLDSLAARLEWISYRLEMERWERSVTGESDSLAFFESLYAYTLSDSQIRSLIQKTRSGSAGEIERRKAAIIERLSRRYVVDGYQPAAGLIDSLVEAFSVSRYEFEGGPALRSAVENIMFTDASRGRREQAYRALVAAGEELAEPMSRLFRLRNQQARREGFNNYFSLLLDAHAMGVDEYRELLATIDELTIDAYRSLVTQLESRLRVERVEPWDLQYAYRNIMADVDARLNADTLMPLADMSFQAIGVTLDELPIYYRLFDGTTGGGTFEAFLVRPPFDQRITGVRQGGHRHMRRLLSETGLALYGANIRQEEAVFQRPLPGPFMQAMAEFFGLFADDARWLSEYAGLPEQVTADYISARRDLVLIELRQALVQQYFEIEAYSDPNQDLNLLYWRLWENHMLLPRHDDLKPWATQLDYVIAPASTKDRLLGRIIAAQTWDYLERFNGSVLDNRDTRSFLIQNYYRFGRRYGWPELVKRGTGETIDPSFLVKHLGF